MDQGEGGDFETDLRGGSRGAVIRLLFKVLKIVSVGENCFEKMAFCYGLERVTTRPLCLIEMGGKR